VQSGDTLIMGGLIRDTKQVGSEGIPWLAKIPVLGGLFGQQEIKDQRSELVLFVTPRVVENQQDMRGLIDDLRRRMEYLDRTFMPTLRLPAEYQPEVTPSVFPPRPPGQDGRAAPPPVYFPAPTPSAPPLATSPAVPAAQAAPAPVPLQPGSAMRPPAATGGAGASAGPPESAPGVVPPAAPAAVQGKSAPAAGTPSAAAAAPPAGSDATPGAPAQGTPKRGSGRTPRTGGTPPASPAD